MMEFNKFNFTHETAYVLMRVKDMPSYCVALIKTELAYASIDKIMTLK